MEVNRLAARPVAWLAAGAAVLAVCGGPAAAVVTPAASVLGLPGAAGRSSVAASGTGRAGQIASRALVRRGVWGKAQLVRGAETGQSAVLSVSCASPGNCSAGGYLTQGESVQAMVLSQRNGAWGKAEVVPGTVPLNTGGQAEVTSVSCASPGNCSAVGTYTTPALVYASPQQVFVVTEHNGTWGQAEEVPGLGALNTGAEAQISAVSCGAAGNCVAGGWYLSGSPTGSSTSVPFVVSQRNGRWGKAQQLPGLTGGVGEVNSVSCGAKDSCVAGGYFGRYHVRPVFNAFVAVQKGGPLGQGAAGPHVRGQLGVVRLGR